MNDRKFYIIFLRYIALFLVAIPNLWLFYAILTPLTIYPVFYLLSIFFKEITLSGTSIILNGAIIQINNACIAGAAFYLLLALNLTTPMKTKNRINAILFSFLSLIIFNILRIFIFSVFFIESFSLFNVLHLLFWHVFSTIVVLLIWFASVKIFKIDKIPVYSDFLVLRKASKN